MAAKIRLSVAVGDYEIIRALKEGSVEADGLELVVLTGHGPRERHWRMARNQEFDVCEFNVGAYLMSRDKNEPLAAIPVFLHRRFRHGFAFVNVNCGIKTPKDLIGKRSVAPTFSRRATSGCAVSWKSITACRTKRLTGSSTATKMSRSHRRRDSGSR